MKNKHNKPPLILLLVALPGMLVSLGVVNTTDHNAIAQESAGSKHLEFGRSERMGTLTSRAIGESSGLAASRRYRGCYWTHNDNGLSPGLFLVESSGKHVATVNLPGAEFHDWEAIATVRRDDRDLIVIGDVGDNLANRESCRLFILDEPGLQWTDDPDEPIVMEVVQLEVIHLRYPEGPVDCEALAVESTGHRIWLVSKQRPGGAHASNGGGRNGNLEKTALHFIDWPEEITERPITATRLESRFDNLLVTGMDFSRDGRLAIIRTYFDIELFSKQPGESWKQRLAGDPDSTSVVPFQRQGEAIAFDLESTAALVTSEGFQQPVWKLPLVESERD